MLRKLPILLMLLTSSFLSWGQGRSILGTVISATDAEPVIGANVQLKGKSVGTVTDIDGTFRLSVTETDILVISYIGFETLEIPVEGRSELHIKLLEDTRLLDEIVAVGYTTQRKVDLTGAVSTVNVSDVENISSGNVMQALKGRIAGMQVTTSGAPDGGSTIRIRGIGTLGNNDPLYIIDGVPSKRSMNELNSNDILDEIILPEYLDHDKTMRAADTDWQKEIGTTGIIQNYNMTLSSGTEKGHALFSIDYYGNEGIVKGTNFNRISTRINSDYYLVDKMIKIGENFSLSKIRKSMVDPGWV